MLERTRKILEMSENPAISTEEIAKRFDVDETFVERLIAKYASEIPTSEAEKDYEVIDSYFKNSEKNFLGMVVDEKRKKLYNDDVEFSPHSDLDFFKIRTNGDRTKYAITGDKIIVRKLVDGDFYDIEYASDSKVVEALESRRK